ncbi:Ldo45p SPAR_M02630 [Saccharomyces paradoxus]|uniref:Ldo45p n=1 Tax=Saccharomyces paradoxus TaxID=27291 RepID=A0A8B8UXF5_SACPA|nr:uncharacterized protein SPAR_M02630 [Saccharomyces paradoxus]QHS75418.1 hypothetical protein SPAR_M02630 [Saccharomyces paradoxus]
MAARNRRKNNKKKSLLGTSAAQEKNATYVLVAEELQENTIDVNMGTVAPPTGHHENSMPAKEFKHQQKLEPIDEHEDGEDELLMKFKSMTKCSGPVTEADVQKLLLSYAFTSASIQEDENEEDEGEWLRHPIKSSSPSASSLSAYFQSFVEKCKQVFYKFSLHIIEKLSALQNSLYEVFWIIVIYVNYWFPNVGDYLRYVCHNFFHNKAIVKLLTCIFTCNLNHLHPMNKHNIERRTSPAFKRLSFLQ